MATERRINPPLAASQQPKVMDLMPGHVALGLAGDHMKTLLGSCVSIILTDPRRTVGAMCHIVHVGQPNAANFNNTAYGEVAMEAMFSKLMGVGIPAQRCHAYVYGGGNMFPQMFSTTHVGAKNAEWALNFLYHHGIAIVEEHVGGNGYRKVAWTVGREAPSLEVVKTGV